MTDDQARAALIEQLTTAIGRFFVQFTQFEALFVNLAIRALSVDFRLVDEVAELMDLEKRLRLLWRLAQGRGVSPVLMKDVKTAINRGVKLLEHRNVIAHNMPMIAIHGTLTDTPRGMTAGVRKPTSKLKMPAKPATTPDELDALQKSWMYKVEDIERYTADAIDLQRTMRGITERLSKHVRGITGANI